MVLGNSLLIPILPQMKQALSISQFKVSLTITLFSIPAGLTIPFAGFFSDRLNRKIIIAVALLVYGFGGIVAGIAALLLNENAYYLIMCGRVLQGIGAAGTAPIAMALAGDIFTSSERSRVLGLMESANGLGKVTSPILGSLIGFISWWAAFFLFPVLCIPIVVCFWFFVQEATDKKQAKPFREYLLALSKIFNEKGISLIATFVAGATVLFILFGILFYLSDHLETRYKIEGITKGFVLAIPVLIMSIMSYITGLIIQSKESLQKIFIVSGLILQAAALVVVPFFQDSTYILIAALIIAGLASGAVLPCLNTLITGSCSIEERGMVTALYGGVRFFGVAGGPPLIGFFMEKSVMWTFVIPAILAGLAAIFNLLFLKQRVLKKEE
jgi:ACDE family multidrug resistance protein